MTTFFFQSPELRAYLTKSKIALTFSLKQAWFKSSPSIRGLHQTSLRPHRNRRLGILGPPCRSLSRQLFWNLSYLIDAGSPPKSQQQCINQEPQLFQFVPPVNRSG